MTSSCVPRNCVHECKVCCLLCKTIFNTQIFLPYSFHKSSSNMCSFSWMLMRSVKQWKSPSFVLVWYKEDSQVVPIGDIASFRCLCVVQIQDDLRSRGAFFYFAIIKLSVSHNVYPLSIFKLGWDVWHIHLLNIVLKGPVPSWLQQSTSAALQSI